MIKKSQFKNTKRHLFVFRSKLSEREECFTPAWLFEFRSSRDGETALSTDAWSGKKKNYEAYTPGMRPTPLECQVQVPIIIKYKNYNRKNNIQKSWINRYSTVGTSVVPKSIYGQHNPIQVFAEYQCVRSHTHRYSAKT